MSGEGIAAIITSLAGFATSIGTVILQLRTGKVARSNADKLDAQSDKIDEVHAATTAIVESTGTHKALDGNP
jgi:hypothetical protein